MADTGKTIGLIKALASVDPEVIQSSVEGWLDDHPEATTTVQDGSITKQKLDQNLQQTVDDVGDLKRAVNSIDEQINGETMIVPVEKTASDLDTILFYIGSSSGKWIAATSLTGTSVLADLSGCEKISITAKNGQDARIAFLKDDSCAAGDTPNYAGGATLPTIVSAGDTYVADVPADANVLCVYYMSSSGSLVIPEHMLFYYEQQTNNGILQNLNAINTGKFAHFSFDDVRFCMIDLTNNEETYDSIFDNPFFAYLKGMHETYGAVFSLYLFLNSPTQEMTIEDYTDAFADDFIACSSWLKFGLHEGADHYGNATTERAAEEYETFVTEIIRICGSINSIDRCPRLGQFKGNLAAMQTMRDAEAGIVGLLARYNDAASYYLTDDQSHIIFSHGKYVDTVNRLTFYRSIKTFEEYDPAVELPILETTEGMNRNSYAVMMMHEYGIYTSEYTLVQSMCNRVSYACNWAHSNGYYWNYPMNEIIKSTHGVSSEEGGVEIDDTAGAGDTDVTWSANKLTSEFASTNLNISYLDTQINGSSGGTQDITSSVEWTSGGSVQYQNGNIFTEASNYSYADIPLNNAVHVAGYTRAGQESTKGMCFMTANKTWISGDYNAGMTTYDWNYSFDVPANAAILRICCATSKLADFTCVLTFTGTEGIVDEIDEIDDRVTVLEEQSADVDIDELESNISHNWIDTYAVLNAFTISSSNRGLYVYRDTQSIAEADVSNCAGGYINGHTRLGDDYAIAFYDGNGVCISGATRPAASDYEWDFNLSVPKEAKKVAITCKTTSKSLFTLKGKGIDKGVSNIRTKSALEYSSPFEVFGLDSDRSDFHYDSETRLQDIYTWFDILASTFPRNITRVKLGDSTEPEGTYATIDSNTYPIYAYIIQGDSYVSGNDFIIASGIHGDESVGDGIQSVVSVAYFIRDMLCNPGKNEYLQFMKWNCRILVIPVMNPWGYQNGKRCNGRGVDCNRNFDINFDPTYESYGYSSGTEAFSENESDAVATYIAENFATAKYCTELHTRGGNTLPSDDRWFTSTTEGETDMQNAVSQVGYYMKWLYGGTVSNGQQAVATLPATFRAYVDHVLNIPANLIECAKSVNMDITTFNSDLVQRQYVQYLGSMTQKLVETFVM